MIQVLQAQWTAVTVGIVIYAVTTWLALRPSDQLRRAAFGAQPTHSASARKQGPSWVFSSPELSEALTEIKQQREALRFRSKELDELEMRLKAERQEIYSVTQTVSQLRADLDSMITRVSEEESVNLKRLAKVYSAMTPEGAARILKEMDDEQTVKILSLMKEADSARILEGMAQGGKSNSVRAASLSIRLRLTIPPPKKT